MAKLMVHRNILQKFSKLPLKVQKRIPELIDEFQKDPFSESIGMHPVSESMLDSKVRGIKKLPDGYRAIVIAPERGDTYLLIYIDKHDEAYQWARNKRFEVHEMTGVFQIFDAEELQSATTVTPSPQTGDYPLSRLSDDELFQAGVPKPLIPAVKSIQSDEASKPLVSIYHPIAVMCCLVWRREWRWMMRWRKCWGPPPETRPHRRKDQAILPISRRHQTLI